MNNTAIQNRNESFFIDTEKFSARRKTVYNLIKDYGKLTSQEVKAKMVLGVNQVSGRITELKDSFYIKEAGSKFNETSRKPNTLWAVTGYDERIDLINFEFIKLRNERDVLINDLNLLNLSKMTKERLLKRVKQIDKLIFNLENL